MIMGFNEAQNKEVAVGSGGPYANKTFTSCSRQTTTATPYHLVFLQRVSNVCVCSLWPA